MCDKECVFVCVCVFLMRISVFFKGCMHACVCVCVCVCERERESVYMSPQLPGADIGVTKVKSSFGRSIHLICGWSMALWT